MIKLPEIQGTAFPFLNIFKNVLKSYWMTVVLLCLGLFCWLTDNTMVCVFVYLAIFLLTLAFVDDVKILFCMVMYVSFFINDIVEDPRWLYYIGAIACAMVALICFLVRSAVLERKTFKKGKLFVGFIFALLAFTVGGIARPHLLAMLITWALFIATYVLYFIAVNKTQNLTHYLCFLFFVGSIILIIQKTINGLQNKGLINPFNPTFYCAQNINTVAVFMMLGMIGAFGLGLGKKYGFLSILIIPIIFLGIITTCCRTVIAVSGIITLPLMVLSAVFAVKKVGKICSWAILGSILLALLIAFFVKKEAIIMEIKDMLEKTGGGVSGRDQLWYWCWDKFEQFPLFGYGFVAGEPLPSLRNDIPVVLAHNTLLQWLTSLGLIGSAFISVFYFYKYYAIFKGFRKTSISMLAVIIALALIGTLDQSPTMDFFAFFLPILCIAGAENQDVKRFVKLNGEK